MRPASTRAEDAGDALALAVGERCVLDFPFDGCCASAVVEAAVADDVVLAAGPACTDGRAGWCSADRCEPDTRTAHRAVEATAPPK